MATVFGSRSPYVLNEYLPLKQGLRRLARVTLLAALKSQ